MSNNKENRSGEEPRFEDRRKKADWMTKAASVLSLVSWFMSMVMLLCLDRASPETENLFSRLLGTAVRSTWNTSLLRTAFLLLLLAFCICAIAMIFNILRNRRKSDKYKKSIIILGALTLIGIVAFLIRFGAYL